MSGYFEVEHIVSQRHHKDYSDFEEGKYIISTLEIAIYQMDSACQKTNLYDYVKYQGELQTQSCQYQNEESHRITVTVSNSIVTFRPFFNTL